MIAKQLLLHVMYCAILVTILSACSSKQLYQKWDGSEGYRDSMVNMNLVSQPSGVLRIAQGGLAKDSVYLVEFYGSRTEDGAWCGAMYRAAEFTLERGHNYFTILSDTIILKSTVSGATENATIAGRRGPAGQKNYGISGEPRPVCIKTFTMGNGPTPGGSLNAESLLNQYGGEIRRPVK